MHRLLTEPLIHFLLLGAALFWVYDALNPNPPEDPSHIMVDSAALLNYMQHRAKRFDTEAFTTQLETLPIDRLNTLIQDFSRDEVLYREAKALNLDANDAVARRRLIQQLTYITRSILDAGVVLSDAELREYHQANLPRYHEPATITFTHVYFSLERHGQDAAVALAQTTLKTLNDQQVPFHQGLAHGERFLYHRNYVAKDAELVASHFGPDLQAKLFAATPNSARWQGPFLSHYGAHLVMITGRTEPSDPPLAMIKQHVQQDAQQARVQQQLDQRIADLMADYSVQLSATLQARLSPSAEKPSPEKAMPARAGG